HAYRAADAAAMRRLRLRARYFDAVGTGTKPLSVRWSESRRTGPALAYFEDTEHGTIPVVITSVTRTRLDALAAADLELTRPAGLQRYLANLRSHYPTMPEDATVEIVRFRRTTSDI